MTRWSESRVGLCVAAVASLTTAIIAWPIVHSPQARIFGNEIVGRQHDPFTVMYQFQNGGMRAEYWQPLTDQLGAALASGFGPVAAYNIVVLATIPLAAAFTYALGRFLGISRLGSSVAAFAYAYAPVHMAHAAYHVHVAQTQWLPLFLLALWACVDRPSVGRGVLLVAGGGCVLASGFYNGLIALVVTPAALIAGRVAAPAQRLHRSDWIPAGALITAGTLAGVYAAIAAPDVWHAADYAVPRTDVILHSARWWAYLLPPVNHPLWGWFAVRVWSRNGTETGLLEQQVSVSWALLALAVIAVSQWWRNRHDPQLRWIPVLLVVATWGWLCSLAPDGVIAGVTFPRPTALLYAALPMFRAYARFGIVVALMLSLLAGMGAAWLVARRPAVHWVLSALLLMLFVDLVPLPWRYRDVLPTLGHRWLADQSADIRALDCAAPHAAESLVPWLMQGRLEFSVESGNDCGDPRLAEQLSARGYTHMLVRTGQPWSDDAPWPREGFRLVRSFPDSQVLAVTAPTPALVTLEMPGFYDREELGADRWRWMGAAGWWRVSNTTPDVVEAYLDIELEAFRQRRVLTLAGDAEPPLRFEVEPHRMRRMVGPFFLAPGAHTLSFKMLEPATVADTILKNGDGRAVSIRVFDWRWSSAPALPLDVRRAER